MAKPQEKKPDATQATKLVELAKGAKLFHDAENAGYAIIDRDGHKETYRIRSKHFRHWLAGQYFKKHGTTPGTQALQDAIGVIEGQAVFQAPEAKVNLRVGGNDERIVIDLGNGKWDSVVIDKDGWRVEEQSPVLFYRPKSLQALPYPRQCTDGLELFRKILNIPKHYLPLLIGWMIAALRPCGPYPILLIHGEQGSAKSTMCKFCRRLVDPNGADLRSSPRDERDAIIAAANSWVFALENLSSISTTLSDILCRMSTGGGFATRELYTDSEEVIFNVQRPVLINGIEELATRSDLLDRSILLTLPAIPSERRRTEKEIWKEFNEVSGLLLGCLLDAVSMGIRHLNSTELDNLPRMADFAQWVTSAETAFGWNGDFMLAYAGNRSDSIETAIEANPIGQPLVEFIRDVGCWEGTSSELLAQLNGRVIDAVRIQREKSKSWPKNGRAISGQLRRVAPNLRQADFEFVSDLPGRKFRISVQSTVATVPTGETDEGTTRTESHRDERVRLAEHPVDPVGSRSSTASNRVPTASGHQQNGSDGLNGPMLTHSKETGRICADCGAAMQAAPIVDGWRNWDCPDCGKVMPIKESAS